MRPRLLIFLGISTILIIASVAIYLIQQSEDATVAMQQAQMETETVRTALRDAQRQLVTQTKELSRLRDRQAALNRAVDDANQSMISVQHDMTDRLQQMEQQHTEALQAQQAQSEKQIAAKQAEILALQAQAEQLVTKQAKALAEQTAAHEQAMSEQAQRLNAEKSAALTAQATDWQKKLARAQIALQAMRQAYGVQLAVTTQSVPAAVPVEVMATKTIETTTAEKTPEKSVLTTDKDSEIQTQLQQLQSTLQLERLEHRQAQKQAQAEAKIVQRALIEQLQQCATIASDNQPDQSPSTVLSDRELQTRYVQQLQRLQAELDTTRMTLKTARNALKKSEQLSDLLKAEKADLQRQVAALRDSQTQVTDLESRLAVMSEQLVEQSVTTKTVEKLRQAMNAREARISQLTQHLDDIRQHNVQQTDELREQLMTQQRTCSAEKNALQAQLQDSQNARQAAEKTVEKLHHDIENQAEVKRLRAELKSAAATISMAEERLVLLVETQQDMQQLQRKVVDMQTLIHATQATQVEEQATYQNRLQTLETALNEARAQQQQLRETHKTALAEAQQALADSREQFAALMQQHKDLQQIQTDTEANLQSGLQALEEAQQDLYEMQNTVEICQSQRATLESAQSAQQAHLQTLESNLTAATLLRTQIQADYEQIQENCAQSRSAYQSALHTIQAKLESLKWSNAEWEQEVIRLQHLLGQCESKPAQSHP